MTTICAPKTVHRGRWALEITVDAGTATACAHWCRYRTRRDAIDAAPIVRASYVAAGRAVAILLRDVLTGSGRWIPAA